jgi:TPR repeat protein
VLYRYVEADLDESAKWFRLAAKNGMPEAGLYKVASS